MIYVGIVGVGNISTQHIEGLLTFPEKCKIVALCDIYLEKAHAAKEKYHLDCKVFQDYKEMMNSSEKIDLVHVCTPPSVHAEISIFAMEHGKHVLVEKPMAPSLKECDEMLLAEQRNHVTLGCIAQNRFRNSIYKLKKMADSGLAGKIRCAHINSLWWRGHSYYDLWWRGTWEKEGGGPTLNHAVHHIDMLNWIQGELPVEVTAMLANVMHDNSEVEDISFAGLRYADGSVAEVTSSVVHHGEEQGVILQCEKAKLEAPWSCRAEVSQENGFPEEGHNQELLEKLQKEYNAIEDLQYEGHTGEIENMLTALEKGEKPLITGKDGKRTVELITAIYKAGFQKKTVSLPITEEDEYYTVEGIQKNAVHFYEKTGCIENFAAANITVGNYQEK